MIRKPSLILFCLFFLFGCFTIYAISKRQTKTVMKSKQTRILPTLTNHPDPSRKCTYKEKEYAYEYFMVDTITSLSLIPNFEQRKPFSEWMDTARCTAAINGGYYDTDDKPLGAFTGNGTVLKKPVTNRLIDGYISTTRSQAAIGLSPLPNPFILLQSGPLLYLDGKPLSLKIISDEPARRSVGMLTDDGILIFMVMYDPASVYFGPNLADLPAIISIIKEQEGLIIQSAINLDGGNASAFKNERLTLTELTHVGSMFCLQ